MTANRRIVNRKLIYLPTGVKKFAILFYPLMFYEIIFRLSVTSSEYANATNIPSDELFMHTYATAMNLQRQQQNNVDNKSVDSDQFDAIVGMFDSNAFLYPC